MEEKDLQGTENQEEQVETLTMTQDDLQKLLQQEGDKRVSSAIQKQKEKWEAEYKEKLEVEKSEAEKLAKMSEAEKLQAQFNQEKTQFENEKKQFLKEKLELETIKQLSALELPVEFSTFVLGNDAEVTKQNIDSFASQWQKAIEFAVDKKLQGHTPKAANGSGTTMTKENFSKMSYAERLELFNTNPELYNQIKG
ncbi:MULTISPECIES: DUF4355 domain-containing protein [Gammaproteobacteria]|uniref:DUF4355 domain-containing protein n=1 Tax=Acinetobacter sp. HRXRD-152 TaxID=3404808 RepID=UPI003BB5EF84